MAQPEILLGQAIGRYRLSRGYTLEELGRRTDLTKSYLSKLENGKTSPSIPALQRIAAALDVSLATLLDDLDDQGDRLIVVRKNVRKELSRGGSALGYAYQRLAGSRRGGLVEMFVVSFAPGNVPTRPFTHKGHEFNLVLQGRVRFTHGQDVCELEEGDSVYYDSSVPHLGIALGSEEACVISVLVAD